MISARAGCFGAAALAVACGSCTGDLPADLVPPTGTLEAAWTIAGSTDASVCPRYDAVRMRIVVVHYERGIQATELAPCVRFQAAIVLDPGTYTANATLLDEAGSPVSETLAFPEFEVEDDIVVGRSIDFAERNLLRSP